MKLKRKFNIILDIQKASTETISTKENFQRSFLKLYENVVTSYYVINIVFLRKGCISNDYK